MVVAYNRFKKQWGKNMGKKASVADIIKSLNLRKPEWEEALISEFGQKPLDTFRKAVDSGKIREFKGIGPKNYATLYKMLEEPARGTAAVPTPEAASKNTQADLLDALNALARQQAATVVAFQQAVESFKGAVDILHELAEYQKQMWKEAQAQAEPAVVHEQPQAQPVPEPEPVDAQPLQAELFIPAGVFLAPSDTGLPAPTENETTGNFSPDRVPDGSEQEALRVGMWNTASERGWVKDVVKHMAGILGTGQNPMMLDAGTWNAILTNLESTPAKEYWAAKFFKRYPHKRSA